MDGLRDGSGRFAEEKIPFAVVTGGIHKDREAGKRDYLISRNAF
jgi:hypothetical protein